MLRLWRTQRSFLCLAGLRTKGCGKIRATGVRELGKELGPWVDDGWLLSQSLVESEKAWCCCSTISLLFGISHTCEQCSALDSQAVQFPGSCLSHTTTVRIIPQWLILKGPEVNRTVAQTQRTFIKYVQQAFFLGVGWGVLWGYVLTLQRLPPPVFEGLVYTLLVM